MKKALLLTCLAVAVFALPALIIAGEDKGHSKSGHEMKHDEGHHDSHMAEHHGHAADNPLRHEMMILDAVFREVVSAVAVADGWRVYEALADMHGTMEKTHEGVHEGKVKIPRNADKLDEFVKMDREFHANIEKLAEAAHKNDAHKMLSLTKVLLDGCVSCHAIYR